MERWQSLLSRAIQSGNSEVSDEESAIQGITLIMKEYNMGIEEVKRLPLYTYVSLINYIKEAYDAQKEHMKSMKAK